MFLLIALSALICAQINLAYGSHSNYNNFNKQQYQSVQSQAFGQNYQHQTHHNQHQNQQSSYQPNRNVIPITSYKNEVSHDGSYQYSYSTGNGIKVDESGYLKNRGSQHQAQVAQGSYSYTAPNGQLIEVRYIADENGYRAEGNHIPTPPPIPKAIQESLNLIARTQPAPATHNYQHSQHNQQGQYNQQQHYNQQHQYGK